jgi:glycosyltransferase involved in cell wall biosynthesis
MQSKVDNSTISIVVPVYNVEKYLTECIDSILAQSFSPFEILLVDDGSQDSSGDICDKYADAYRNLIKVFHQPNGGVTSARKTGVENASGEWICFVDSDDTLPVDSLKELVTKSSTETDIVVGAVDKCYEEGVMQLGAYRKAMIEGRTMHTGPVARFFRKSLFNSEVFNIPRDITFGEDMLMNIRLAFVTTKDVAICGSKVYNYRLNEVGASKVFRHTCEYESMFHNLVLASLPDSQHDTFLTQTIRSRFAAWCEIISGKIKISESDLNSHFYRTLILDATNCEDALSKSQMYVLTHTSTFSRIIIRISEIYKNRIKR